MPTVFPAFFSYPRICLFFECPVHNAEALQIRNIVFHRLASHAPSIICSHGRRNGSNLREYLLGGIVTLPALQNGGNRSNLLSPDLGLPSPCKGVTVTRFFTVTRLDQHGERGFGISGAGKIKYFDEEQASVFTVTRYVIVQFDDTISVAAS